MPGTWTNYCTINYAGDMNKLFEINSCQYNYFTINYAGDMDKLFEKIMSSRP